MPDPAAPGRRLPGRQQEARSNDSAVLAAAREVFAMGRDASMVEIAHRAGVGVASIYRRYPTKEALVEALRMNAVSEAAKLAHEIAATADGLHDVASLDPRSLDSGGAVAAFLARQITGLSGPALQPYGSGPMSGELAAVSEDLHIGLDQLVARDQAAGVIPGGFTAADVMQLLLHLRPTLPYPRARADALNLRYLAFAMQGLREQARAGIALADGPPWDEWMGSWQVDTPAGPKPAKRADG